MSEHQVLYSDYMLLKSRMRTTRLYRGLSRAVTWYLALVNNPSPSRRWLSLAIFSGVIFVSLLGLFRIFDPYPLRDWIYLRLTLMDLGYAGMLVYLIMLTVIPLFSPLSLIIVTGSAAYGPFLGMILSYVGCLLNANLAFFLVKSLSLEKAWGKGARAVRLKEAIWQHGYLIVLVLQLITVIPFTMINAAAAGAGISWKDFMKATSLGVWPCIILYSFLGHRIIARAISPEVYFASICVLALSILLIALRKKDAQVSGKGLP